MKRYTGFLLISLSITLLIVSPVFANFFNKIKTTNRMNLLPQEAGDYKRVNIFKKTYSRYMRAVVLIGLEDHVNADYVAPVRSESNVRSGVQNEISVVVFDFKQPQAAINFIELSSAIGQETDIVNMYNQPLLIAAEDENRSANNSFDTWIFDRFDHRVLKIRRTVSGQNRPFSAEKEKSKILGFYTSLINHALKTDTGVSKTSANLK